MNISRHFSNSGTRPTHHSTGPVAASRARPVNSDVGRHESRTSEPQRAPLSPRSFEALVAGYGRPRCLALASFNGSSASGNFILCGWRVCVVRLLLQPQLSHGAPSYSASPRAMVRRYARQPFLVHESLHSVPTCACLMPHPLFCLRAALPGSTSLLSSCRSTCSVSPSILSA